MSELVDRRNRSYRLSFRFGHRALVGLIVAGSIAGIVAVRPSSSILNSASSSGGGTGLTNAIVLIDQYPSKCLTDPNAGVISANAQCTGSQLTAMRAGAQPNAKFLVYMKGPICWSLVPCSQFAEADFAHTASGGRLHPTWAYSPNMALFIMNPASTAWQHAMESTCASFVSKGWDGCYNDLEGASSWNDCVVNSSATCVPGSPDGTASDGYAWSQQIAQMQKAMTSALTSGLPTALWGSNGIGSAQEYVSNAPRFSSRNAPAATNFGSTAEGYSSADFANDMTLLSDTHGVFLIAKGDHMTDLASFLEGVQYGSRYGWSWCGSGAARNDCAKADGWLVNFNNKVSTHGGARYTNTQGLTERDYGSGAQVVYNTTASPITYRTAAGSILPDGSVAPSTVTIKPAHGYITIGGSSVTPSPTPTATPTPTPTPTATPTPTPTPTPSPTPTPTPTPTPSPCSSFSSDVASQAPTVTSISPRKGSSAGGTSVNVFGSGLTHASSVVFGHDKAQSYRVVSDCQIIAKSPAIAPDIVDIVVSVGSRSSARTPNDWFTVTAMMGIN